MLASGADVAHDTPQENDGGDDKKERDYRVYCRAKAGKGFDEQVDKECT